MANLDVNHREEGDVDPSISSPFVSVADRDRLRERYRGTTPGRLSGSIGTFFPFLRETALPACDSWVRRQRDRRSFRSLTAGGSTKRAFRRPYARRAHLRSAMDASKGMQKASFVHDGSGEEQGRGGMRNEAKRRRNKGMEGVGIDTDERPCTRCLTCEGGCATMEKKTDVPCVGKGNDGEGKPLGTDGRARRASPNETRADAPQPKEVQVQHREHLSMEQENEAKPVQKKRERTFDNGTRDIIVEEPFANGNPTQAGLQNIGQGEVDMVFGQNPAENRRSPPIPFFGNPQVPHLATPPFESLPDALQQSIDGGGGVELTVPQKAPGTVPRRDSEPETKGGIGTIPDDKSIPAPGEVLSSDRRADQWPLAERDAQGLLNTADPERENKCTSGSLEEYKTREQALLSHPQAKGDGLLQTQDAALDSRRQDEGPLQGKAVDAVHQEKTYKEDAQENGKSKRKLGEAVNLKSKKSVKRGTKGKQAHEIKKKEQTVQVSQVSCNEKLL